MDAGEIARLQGLLDAATPGPWGAIKGAEVGDDMRCAVVAERGDRGFLVATIENGAPGDCCDTEYANAEVIAAIRNALPSLLAQLTADRAALDAARAALNRYARHDGLCGIVGGYGYCTCGLDAALDALPARQGKADRG